MRFFKRPTLTNERGAMKSPLFHGFHQFLLAPKMEVKTSLGNPCFGGDLIHGDATGPGARHKVSDSLLDIRSDHLIEKVLPLCFAPWHVVFAFRKNYLRYVKISDMKIKSNKFYFHLFISQYASML